MSLHESPLSAEQVERILKNWTPREDTCRDDPERFEDLKLEWPCDPRLCKDVFGESMTVKKTRDLPEPIAEEARAYIRFLVARYPFQLRQEMARPMWHRFLDMWNDTGNRQKALRKI